MDSFSSDVHSVKGRIFISGTGRCGTSILAHTIAQHPDILYFAEPRFLIDSGGVHDLLHRRITWNKFQQNMISKKFCVPLQRSLHISRVENAEEIYSIKKISEIFMSLEDIRFHRNLPLFCERFFLTKKVGFFIDELFSLALKRKCRGFWLEKTPHTILMANHLSKIFPNMKYIHIIRDPKDVCCSTLKQKWGATTVEEFIKYYNKMMKKSWNVRKNINKKQYLVVSFDKLVDDVLGNLKQIFEFINISHDHKMLRSFSQMIDTKQANQKRHEQDLSEKENQKIENSCYPIYLKWLALTNK